MGRCEQSILEQSSRNNDERIKIQIEALVGESVSAVNQNQRTHESKKHILWLGTKVKNGESNFGSYTWDWETRLTSQKIADRFRGVEASERS